MEPVNSILDRFKSPILGNFILSWMTCNWRVPYTTFFVDQDKTGFSNKLAAIESLIYSASVWQLLFLPILLTIIIIFAIPYANHIAEKLPIKFKYKLLKYENEKEQELNGIKQENKNLKKQLEDSKELSRNELIKRILYDKEGLQNIFIGGWKIIVHNQTEIFHHYGCYIRKNNFVESTSQNVILSDFFIENTEQKDINSISIRAKYYQDEQSKSYNVEIRSRDEIVLRETMNGQNTITFKWTYLDNFYYNN